MVGDKDRTPTGSLVIVEQIGEILSDVAPSLLATLGDIAVNNKYDQEWVARLQVATAQAGFMLAALGDGISQVPAPMDLAREYRQGVAVTGVLPEVNVPMQAVHADQLIVPGTKIKLQPELFGLYESVKLLVENKDAGSVSVEDIIYNHYDVDDFSDEAKTLVTKYLDQLVRHGLISYDKESLSYSLLPTPDSEAPDKADTPRVATPTFLTKRDIEPRPADPAVFTERLVTAIKTIIANGNGGKEMRYWILAPIVRDGLETDDATTVRLLRQLAEAGLGHLYRKRGRDYYAVEKPGGSPETQTQIKKREARERDAVFTELYIQIAAEVFDELVGLEPDQGMEMKKLWARSVYKTSLNNIQYNAVLRRLEVERFLELYDGRTGGGRRSKKNKVKKVRFVDQNVRKAWRENRKDVISSIDMLVTSADDEQIHEVGSELSTEQKRKHL